MENLTDLAESVSESGVGDASTDDDNVGVGGNVVHRLGSRLSNDLFLHSNKPINRTDECENRDDDHFQRVLIQCHRHR